jgi:hypothetical protein
VILPDVVSMLVEIKVNEAQIDKVAVGQPASVRVDAFPDRNLGGKVVRVSTLPDPTKNPEVKVYRVGVLIDAENRDGMLRPGMNGTVEIGVGRLDGVLAVPLAAVKRRGDAFWVFRREPTGHVPTKVKLGSNNLTHVQILDGLQAGDDVWLVQPEGAQLPAGTNGRAERPQADQGEGDNQPAKKPAKAEPGDRGDAPDRINADRINADRGEDPAAKKSDSKKKKDKPPKADGGAPGGGER